MPNPNESKLPAAQQARRDRLIAEANADTQQEPLANNAAPQNTPQNNEQPPQNNAPPAQPQNNMPPAQPQNTQAPAQPQNNTSTEGASRISEAEIEQLRREALEARNRASLLELELAESRSAPPQGLTSDPAGSKGGNEAPAPSAPADRVLSIDPGEVDLDDKEREDYGEAEGVIAKVAKREIANLLNPFIARLEARITQLETGVRTVTDKTVLNEEQSFIGKVREKVQDFDKIVRNPKWQEFMESKVPLTGLKFKDAIAQAHSSRQIAEVEAIFGEFKKRYQEDPARADGYNAVNTNSQGSGSEAAPNTSKTESKLPFSERRKASDDFLKGRITREQLDEIKEKYRAAEENGNIDYDS